MNHEAFSYALFTQKAQKRTVVNFSLGVDFNFSEEIRFISLPAITYSVIFKECYNGDRVFEILLVAHVNEDGIPTYLPLHNVARNGEVCFGYDLEFEGSLEEMAEYAVSNFWNSKFDGNSFRKTREALYGNTPLVNFRAWAEYTKEHPEWIPRPHVPIELLEWLKRTEPPLPPENSR